MLDQLLLGGPAWSEISYFINSIIHKQDENLLEWILLLPKGGKKKYHVFKKEVVG